LRKRAIVIGMLFGIGICGLSGCKNSEKTAVSVENSAIEQVEEMTSADKDFSEEPVLEEPETELEVSAHESRNPSSILEDEEAVYFCGRQHILKWYKETQQTDIIWMTDKEKITESAYAYRDMQGILLGDKIYFVESWLKDPVNPLVSETLYALSVVNTDGSNYREIEQFSGLNRLMLLDGILYFSYDVDSKALEGYVVDGSGELLTESGKVIAEPANVPEGYTEMSYCNNGMQFLMAVESGYRFGYYVLHDENYELCKVDQNTGEKDILPEEYKDYFLLSYNQNYFLMIDYEEDAIYLIDTGDWESDLLINIDSSISIINMDEEYVYWMRYSQGDDFSQNIFERISIETGIVEDLFVLDSFVGMPDESPWYLMDIAVVNDYLYYVGAQDYKYYLMRRDVNMPGAEEIIGEAFFDSGISQIGDIKTYKEIIYSENNPEVVLGEIDLEWLVVDEKFPGASQINLLIEEEQKGNIAYEREMALSMEEWAADGGIGSSLTSSVSPIYYFNERYISYTQQNYDYTGGAHGMPYWIPYTFDLETGEELGLSDIVANNEEEFKKIVTAEFTEMYNVDPGMYWDNAVENVHEWTSMESPFYLSEEGLVIYYGPYDLASYAAGFQEIIVPYEELELYIPLGN